MWARFGFVLYFIISIHSNHASASSKLTEVLMVGDSWAAMLCFYKSFEKVWGQQGYSAETNMGCLQTTRFGMQADRWNGSRYDRETRQILADNLRIQTVILSLGGNDLLGSANKNMSLEELDAVFLSIKKNVERAIDTYREIRPDVRIIVSGYDYPRFTADNKIPQYRKVYNRMGQPTPEEINHLLIRFSHQMTSLREKSGVFYVHHLGLTHYYYGIPNQNLSPGQTMPPNMISSPNDPFAYGGWVTEQTPGHAMLRIGESIIDAFHISRPAFGFLAEHIHDLYLQDWLPKSRQR